MSSILRASHLRKAEQLGKRKALDEILYGATEPRDGILSGEWADERTPYDLCTEVGFPHWADVDQEKIDADEHSEMVSEIADRYEEAYADKFELVAECEHTFTGRGTRGFVPGNATCDRCGVSVMAGSNLI